MAPKVLVVLTSFGYIDSAKKETGWYLPEFAHPHEILASKGVEIVTASPKGGVAPLDPASVEQFKSDASSVSFLNTKSALWQQTAKIWSFLGRSEEFDALFYPGGYGPMFDLATNTDSIALIKEFVAAGKPVAAVCHGPIAFTGVKLPDGKPLLAGKKATGFSNAEEESIGLLEHLPFTLENKMKEVGAEYKSTEKVFEPFVVVEDGGKLITGQNPGSSAGVGEALAKAIGV
ncbi:class I glutamine amidotransferase-like protein [Daldinia vernicosa]|uniref:class I glutamine amidotransferase-like protein n=1 Tax=Daldinia vernicosa TaxID=114800 RepID=UPI00200776C1|nr:class I glutamine amidotransferase-like protein [Daldinia vernicosa]KAI0849482.1 class I glutamine amidotransferase-like protein [Daldinia vernicosa]